MLKLREERMKQGLSQFKLAVLAQVDPGVISRIEGGKVYAYPRWRQRLAKALGWPTERADELFEGATISKGLS